MAVRSLYKGENARVGTLREQVALGFDKSYLKDLACPASCSAFLRLYSSWCEALVCQQFR